MNSTDFSIKKNRTMLLLFVASDAFFFLGLIISYVFYTHPGGTLVASAKYLDVVKTGIFSIFLWASSGTMILAGDQLKKGNMDAMRIWLIATLLFGAVFLVGQGLEYSHLVGINLTISTNVFGSIFFTLTGFHGLHVFLGLVTISIMTGLLFSEKYQSVQRTMMESVSIYWHFVDAVWVVIFGVVYLGALK